MTKAKFRRRTSHEPNQMQMRENKGFFAFAFDSAHVKYGVWTWPKKSMCVAIFRKLSAGQHKILSSVTVIKKFTSFLLSYFKSVVLRHFTGEILSFEFHPKAFFEWKFRISRSAIIHVQNWPIGLQRVEWRTRWRQRHTSLKLQRVNAAYCTCKTLKVRNPRATY